MVEQVSSRVDPFVQLGRTGLQQYSGYISEETLPELYGQQGRRIYREMSEHDSVVGAMLFVIEMLTRQVEWTVIPADGGEEQHSDFVEECRQDMTVTWPDLLAEILSFLPYGWSYFELVYKKRDGEKKDGGESSRYSDGKIGWRKIAVRSQDTLDRWEFDDNGGLRGMWQQAPPSYARVFLPIEKCLLFRTTSRKGNPEGVSILRNAYRAWYSKRQIERIEAIGIERDLAGLPVAYIPPEFLSKTATADQKAFLAELKKIVVNVRRDEQEGVIFPIAFDEKGNRLFELTLLNAGGQRQFQTDPVIQRYARYILMACAADFVLLGHEKVGSFALSSDKTELFSVALGAWLDAICDIFNRYAIPRLMKLNGMPTDKAPRLAHGDIEHLDLAALGDYIVKLGTAGVPIFPSEDGALERFLLEQAGLPVSENAFSPEDRERQQEEKLDQAVKQQEALGTAPGMPGAAPGGGPPGQRPAGGPQGRPGQPGAPGQPAAPAGANGRGR